MSVKAEPMDESGAATVVVPESSELEEKIMALCVEYSDGLADAIIQARMPQTDPKQRVVAINNLLAQGKIDLLRSGDMLIYKAKNLATLEKIKGASKEETLIYEIIEEAANRGIWVRDIRAKSNLAQAHLNKVLKNLESRKLVKSIKSVGAAKKKIYMLYELEPDSAVSGGAFYSDQEVDMQFVDLLNQQCLKFLRAKRQLANEKNTDPLLKYKTSFAPSLDVARHINDLKISKIDLTVKDIERVLDTLVYDGVAEKSDQQGAVYRAVEPAIRQAAGYVRVPCSFCPVFRDCRPGFMISPATCAYFKEWLS